MGNFKVGDVCIGQNLVLHTHKNDVECVIVEPLQSTKYGDCYLVHWVNEDITRYAFPYTLRLKRPPSKDEFTAGEWELCPWSPYRVWETS